jgi:hypothetical protein
MAYPVTLTVEPATTARNRLTTAFRLILAIPHIILVGGVGFSASRNAGGGNSSFGGETGLLGAVAWFLAIVSWFMIVFSGQHITGIRQFTQFYLRWKVRALAYLMLFEDQYPPFGDLAYPASVTVVDPTGPRDRLSVGFRLILAIPHFILLFFLCVAWWIVSIVAWLMILFTGEYPRGLCDFALGVFRWFIRVEAYMLLLVDEYPPFSLS